MSNNKFHKILSDTITLPLLPASNFKETNTVYYAVLEKNYIPITSDIICIYKPDWITGYKFIKEGENENETKEDLKYYNKLVITSISDNSIGKLRKDVMEFAVHNINSSLPINHIYAKVSLSPKENIEVHLEFIPTEILEKNGLSADGGIISGDELEIHINYWAKLNDIYLSNITLKLNNNLLDKDKIKSLRINKINSSDNKVIVDLVYLIDENIDIDHKPLEFEAIFKTQYNKVKCSKLIELRLNTYKITLEIDNPNHIVFNGDNRILTYKCTYTDGINDTLKEVKDKDNLYLEFSYEENQNELKYSVIKTIYDTKSKSFKTTINVYENYTSEERLLNIKAVYNGSKKIKTDSITLIQDESNIKLLYYVEYLDRNTSENPTTNGTYNVSAFGETIRLHYYGIIKIDENSSVKITSITNTKNDISNTYTINALVNGEQNKNVILSKDEYILDINFDRYESTSIINDITKTIVFEMNNLTASCILTLSALLINLEVRSDKCTEIIGGIPEYNNIILTFRAYDNKKNITIEDINLYTITCNNNDVNLADIQYKIKTYDNIKYIEASNIRCYYKKDDKDYTNGIYDEKVDRTLTFTVKYNNITEEHDVQLYPVVYSCIINPSSNYVSALGEDNFEVTSVGIIKDRSPRDEEDKDIKQIESAVDVVTFTYTNNDNLPDYITVIQHNKKLHNRSESIIKVEPCSKSGEDITTKKDIVFRIKVKYKDSDTYYDIKQLYLLIYIDLYKDSNYSTLLDYNSLRLNISPFINNILYYKCYIHEINDTDHSHKNVDISKFLLKHFSITSDNWVDVLAYVDENPTYNEDDYTYRGKITIPRYICSEGVTYQFKYMLGYSENLYIYKILNIYKPVIRTCTVDNLNPLQGTYIQYRSDKDSSYNDNKSVLKIGTYDKRISSKDYYVTLYYRTVFTIILGTNDNYIYGNDYKTYIDLGKTHFVSFIDLENITIDNNAFENAEEVKFNDSSYLKIKFKVNKNDDLLKREITKSIKYQFIKDNINGIDYHYRWYTFTNYYNNINNRIEIYLNGASLDLDAFFDSSNSGTITDNGRIITYNAKPHSSQNLHVKVLLNNELQPTYSDYFKFNGDNKFSIKNGILDLNTYKSEYNLELYIGLENETYTFHYCYNGNDENKTKDLTVIRTSFGRDEKCELNAKISDPQIGNNGKTIKITFWLEYDGEKVDLGEDAIRNFNYYLNISTQLIPGKTINVIYDSELKKYSFDYKIDANSTTEGKIYKFSIKFGGDDEKHKKTLICTLSGSSYELKATISPSTLSPLSPSNIIIKCHIEKDNNGQIYQDANPDNFSIIQTNENVAVPILNALETKPSGLLQGEYGKEYPVPDNTTENSITYKFKCSYTLNGNEYSKDLSITLGSATFDVSIYDGETDLLKQNIVNPVGETKTINYFGILNGEHVTENITFKNETVGDGLNFISGGDEVSKDTENKILSRKYKFTSNTTANTITYKFTAKYQNITKYIIFTQKPGEIKLILKNNPDPIPKSGGLCKIIYYGYVGSDPNIKENHVTTDLELNDYSVDGFNSYTQTKVSGPTVTDYLIEYVFSVPARVEDINIDKLLKRNWSVTYKNGDIQKSINKDIVQNGDSEFFPAFDIFGLVYEWSGGKDLDTATLLTRSDNGSLIIADTSVDLCKNSFGYAQTNDKESSKVYNYIAFNSDNTHGCGYESIAINFKKLLADFNLSNLNITLNFDIWMTWYSGRWDGKVTIKFVRYNDIKFQTRYNGNIAFIPIKPFYPLCSNLYLLDPSINQLDTTNSSISITEKYTYVDSKGSASEYKTTYAKVGTLKYNTKQKTAILSINSVANSSIRAYIKNTRVELNITDFYNDICYDETYSLNDVISTNSSILNGVTINMKMYYRDSSVATPVLKDLIYVDCSIYDIDLYDSSDHKTSSTLPRTHKYYNEILSKNIYTPTITSANKFLIPSLDLNGIKLPAPTSFESNTYYGLSSFYIRYMYKYNISSNNSGTFAFTKYINVNNKV